MNLIWILIVSIPSYLCDRNPYVRIYGLDIENVYITKIVFKLIQGTELRVPSSHYCIFGKGMCFPMHNRYTINMEMSPAILVPNTKRSMYNPWGRYYVALLVKQTLWQKYCFQAMYTLYIFKMSQTTRLWYTEILTDLVQMFNALLLLVSFFSSGKHWW